MLLTAGLQRNVAMVQPWVESMQPFIVVGPEGSGKNMLLSYVWTSSVTRRPIA